MMDRETRAGRGVGGTARGPVGVALLLTAGLAVAGCDAGPAAGGDGAEPGEEAAETAEAARPSGPYVRAVGTVQDGGLPHAACTCERCELARDDPRHRRWIASLAVVVPGAADDDPAAAEVYLIDATPDVREQLDRLRDVRAAVAGVRPSGRVDRSPVDGVLLTHAHIGHYLGLAFFGFEAVHTRGLPVFCTPAMAAYLRRNGPWSQLVEIGNVEPREVAPGESFELGAGVRATAVAVPHRDELSDTVGFLLQGPRRSLLYVPDTDAWEAWDPPLVERLRGVDVAILDGSFYSTDELPGRAVSSIGHPLVTRSMDLLEPLVRSGAVEVYFTHMNHSNPVLGPASAARREVEERGFHVLAEGQEIAL